MQPSNYQAWNYVGYASRKVGKYENALAAYDRALSLKPDYAEAIEYRGHAYLGLNRLSEAKAAYLALFAGNRQLAATLLTAMQAWVGEHRSNAEGVDGAGEQLLAGAAFAEHEDREVGRRHASREVQRQAQDADRRPVGALEQDTPHGSRIDRHVRVPRAGGVGRCLGHGLSTTTGATIRASR